MSPWATGEAILRTASRSFGDRVIELTLMALLLALSRKVPVEGVVVLSSRLKARTISLPLISAVLRSRGSLDRVVWFSTLKLLNDARSLPARSWMTLAF